MVGWPTQLRLVFVLRHSSEQFKKAIQVRQVLPCFLIEFPSSNCHLPIAIQDELAKRWIYCHCESNWPNPMHCISAHLHKTWSGKKRKKLRGGASLGSSSSASSTKACAREDLCPQHQHLGWTKDCSELMIKANFTQIRLSNFLISSADWPTKLERFRQFEYKSQKSRIGNSRRSDSSRSAN